MSFRHCLSILCGSASLAAAQPETLSLDDAIRAAWANDPTVAALALTPELARAREVQAGIVPNPEIELRASTPSPFVNDGEWGVGVGINQRLARRERLELARAFARLGAETADYHLREQRRRLAGEVRLRFYEILVQQARHEASERSLAVQREAIATLERGRAVGEVAEVELQLLRLELLRTEQSHEFAEAELAAAHHRLRSRLRLPLATPLHLAGSLDELLSHAVPDATSLDETTRPELALATYAIREADAAVALARAESRADWTVGAGVDFERRENDATGRLENEPRLSVNASVPWPRRVSNRGDILEKEAALRLAGARRDALREELVRELAASLDAVRALQPILLRQRGALVPPAALPGSLRVAFERGEVSHLELAQLRQQQLAIESDFLAAAGRYVAALAEAETLAGVVPAQP